MSADHPAWCSQGRSCHGPKRAADGTFASAQAEAYAPAILATARRLDAGLDGPPGGLRAI